MPSPHVITPAQLARRVGLPDAPELIDVRTREDRAEDPRFLPGAVHLPHTDVASWGESWPGRDVVVICQHGRKFSQGVAAWLRHHGARAETLQDGFAGWAAAGLPLVSPARLPRRDACGRTLWVTRARPKVDRIACPWLIRRFIDPQAVFLFVPPAEVMEVAERFCATPFDVEGVFWSHRGPLCTFDVMLHEFGLKLAPLEHLARIVRAADTATLDQEPEAAGLLAASLGLSRMHRDDLIQLEAGIGLYDAFFRWCRDAAEETHQWPTGRPA